MNARCALASLSITLAATCAGHADYVGLTVESYVGPGWVENGFADLTAWRVYALFDNPTDTVIAGFGAPGYPLSASSTNGAFHNDALYDDILGPCHLTGSPQFHWANQWDSYFSLNGYSCVTGNVSGSGWFAEQVNNLVGGFSTTNAAWFALDLSNPAHQAGPELRVYLAQLVVLEGESVSGYLNIQYNDAQGGTLQAVNLHFQSPDPCPPDVNGDGAVNVLDLLAVLAAWGPCPGCVEDVNGDSTVNVLDLLDVLATWGPCS